MSFLTVLTPIYNRREFIPTLMKSLLSQTNKNFQWLIIDDGSDSGPLHEGDLSDDSLTIDYYYKENGGKHTALNFSHPYIKGDWVLILDSDDRLTADAVETAYGYIEKYGSNKDIGTISLQKGYKESEPLVHFDKETVSDHIEYRINSGRDGDCCEIIRTDVLKEYPFPVFEGEKYMSESHLWIGSADKYKTAYIPKVIYLCEYREDGLTKQGRAFWRKSPKGCMHCHIVGLNKRCSLKFRIKRALLIHYYGRVQGLKNKEICKTSGHSAFLRLFTVPGFLLYKYWERKLK